MFEIETKANRVKPVNFVEVGAGRGGWGVGMYKYNKLQQSMGKIEITVNETEAQFPHNKPFLTWANLDPISRRET